jgi:hypothetical protein
MSQHRFHQPLSARFFVFALFCASIAVAQPVKYSDYFTSIGTQSNSEVMVKSGIIGQPILSYSVGNGQSFRIGRLAQLARWNGEGSGTPQQPAPVAYEFSLGQNYPNPFNPSTVIPFSVDQTAAASLTFYNLLGQQVRDFRWTSLSPGQYSITWDGTSASGLSVPSGQYFVRLEQSGRMTVKKLTLLK